MAQSCCLAGFEWDGTPTGTEGKLGDLNAYIAGNTGSHACILVIHDLFGWTFNNLRLLCDHYAKEAECAVYMPDFFGGEVVSTDILLSDNPFTHPKYDHKAFISRNNKEIRWPEIKSAAEDLRTLHTRTGVIGYCFGGWSSFSLGSSQFTPRLVDCISAAHPTWLTKEEMDNIGVPVQIVAPEHDPVFNPELKKYANEVISTKGLPYDYSFFPGVEHAWGDLKKEGERVSMLRAKRVQVGWMREWLHGDGKW